MSESEELTAPGRGQLVEVWGDTVGERDVKFAVLIGVALSVPSFLGAQALFTGLMTNEDLARTYAMLVGLFMCLVAAGICAKLFAPKRIVSERKINREDQIATVMELAQERAGIGEVACLNDREREDMQRLGLYEIFVEAEKRLAGGTENDASATEPAMPPSLLSGGHN